MASDTAPTDFRHLNGIFYNIYDIDSYGVRPQMQLVETLSTDGRIDYLERPPHHFPSALISMDHISNLFTNSFPIAKIFDPSLFNEPSSKYLVPPDYLEGSEKLRSMRKELEVLKRRGRSFNLRSMAGYAASLSQSELTETEAADVAEKLARKLASRYMGMSAGVCMSFVSGYMVVIGGLERAIYEHWNTEGREERTLYHAAKLDLMNEITDAAIRKAKSAGLDPNMFTRKDP